jgi:hypothetical protein
MKKIAKINILFLFITFHNKIYLEQGTCGNVTGRTFFVDMPLFYAAFPERAALYDYLIPKKSSSFLAAIVATETLTEFFTPRGYNYLRVIGGNDNFYETPESSFKRDIDAINFNITDPYYYSMLYFDFSSQRKMIGLYGEQIISFYDDCIPQWSLQYAIPLSRVTHKICAQEVIKKRSSGSEIKADSTPSLEFLSNKKNLSQPFILNKEYHETNIDHIELNISYNKNAECDSYSGEFYAGIIIPLGDDLSDGCNSKKNYLFPPIIGNGGHYVIQYGTKLEFKNEKLNGSSWCFVSSMNSTFSFPSKEYRMFDLVEREWGRYMACYNNFLSEDQKKTALENFLLLECTVCPLFSFTATTEAIFTQNQWNISLGYTIYTRQAEQIKVIDTLPQVVITSAIENEEKNMINPARRIDMRLSKDDIQIFRSIQSSELQYYASIIRPFDIEKNSAGHPAVLTGIFYTRAWISFDDCNDSTIGIGFSYNYSNNNSSINYARTWLWASISF